MAEPFEFGSFKDKHNLEQEQETQRAFATWLWAFFLECQKVGFTEEQAFMLTGSRNIELTKFILSLFISSKKDETS